MENYKKAKEEFNQKLDELKRVSHSSIYSQDLSDIVLYQKMLELQEQLMMLKTKVECR